MREVFYDMCLQCILQLMAQRICCRRLDSLVLLYRLIRVPRAVVMLVPNSMAAQPRAGVAQRIAGRPGAVFVLRRVAWKCACSCRSSLSNAW